MDRQAALRMLPAVHKVLADPALARLKTEYPLTIISDTIAQVIARLRAIWDESPVDAHTWQQLCHQSAILASVQQVLEQRFSPALRPVLNLTGVVIHTNLGRAPLSERAVEAVVSVAKGYSNLEYDLQSGERGSRHAHVEQRICTLTGAEGALVVNNNAAAVFLVLCELGQGGEAIVSRGQLVEIGGSFRIPDIMKQSGVRLAEIGTTNKTRIRDYAEAVNEHTRLLMRVHTSNYRIIGFTEQPALTELVQLAHAKDIPLVDDLGSGSLFDFAHRGIGDDPVVRHSIDAGVDVVTFSGDKLLGGAQAGIIIGKKRYIERLKKHPLTRALRVDKMTLAALEATLIDHEDEWLTRKNVPVVRMLTESAEDVRVRAGRVMDMLQQGDLLTNVFRIHLVEDHARIGGGALPLQVLPSWAIRIVALTVSANTLFDDLQSIPLTPVVGRIVDDAVLLDVRTLLPGQESCLADAIQQVSQKYI